MGRRALDRGTTALSLLLAVVSWHGAWNLGGYPAAIAYAVAVVLVAVVVLPWAAERLPAGVPVLVLVGLVAVGLVVLFTVAVPAAPDWLRDALGVGSDRANALDVALSRLVEGHYPYAATTYLGNPITPLPGALVLAAPFWWLTGSAAWQNVAWTIVVLPVVGGLRRPRPALLWVLTVAGGLEVLREFVIGDDLVTGAVPAVAAAAWTLRSARDASTPVLAVSSLVLGLTTCTRPHLALVVVIVAAAVGTIGGRRRALLVGGGATVAWAVLLTPVLLDGTARFSPLHVAAKVTGDRGVTLAIVVVAAAALALVVVALLVLRPDSPVSVGWTAAAVLAAPSILSLAHGLAAGPDADIDLTLGAVAVPFALWAAAARTTAPRGSPETSATRPGDPVPPR